ncbi:hypothetical protein GCM10027275_48820 [Rhabdobacter roseus]
MALLASCKPVDPIADGKPRIKAITFPGIPAENVKIDQKNLRITVTLPPTLSAHRTPEATLTYNAQLLPKEWDNSFVGYCKGCETIEVGYRTNPDAPAITVYKVETLPTAPLAAAPLSAPLEHLLSRDRLYIPMLNLYANPLPQKVTFTNQASGEIISAEINENYPNSFIAHKGDRGALNHIGINTSYIRDLLPGTYKVAFTSAEGTTIHIPQPVVLKQGLIQVFSITNTEYKRLQPGDELIVQGLNLLPGTIALSMVDSTDRVIEVPEVECDPYGRWCKLKTPSTLSYGHYLLRITSTGPVKDQTCILVHLRSKPLVPFEVTMFGDNNLSECSIRGPITIQRGSKVILIASGYEPRARFKLTSVQNSSQVYYAPAVLYTINSYPGFEYATIPSDIQSGRYRIVLQALDEQGQVKAEGPPYWREIRIP